MSDWVVLDTPRFQYQAHLLKSRLEAEGIPCFLEGDRITSCAGGYTSSWSNPIGGIKVKVSAADLPAARALLCELNEQSDEPKRVRALPLFWQGVIALYLAFIVGMIIASVHPLLGWATGIFVFGGLLALNWKRR